MWLPSCSPSSSQKLGGGVQATVYVWRGGLQQTLFPELFFWQQIWISFIIRTKQLKLFLKLAIDTSLKGRLKAAAVAESSRTLNLVAWY